MHGSFQESSLNVPRTVAGMDFDRTRSIWSDAVAASEMLHEIEEQFAVADRDSGTLRWRYFEPRGNLDANEGSEMIRRFREEVRLLETTAADELQENHGLNTAAAQALARKFLFLRHFVRPESD